MLTLRVRVAFGCLSEEDVSALRHGTVFKVIRTGFMTNNDRRLKGICQDSVSPPSRDYQVIMHAFFTRHCEVFTLSYHLYTRIYYVRKEIAKTPTSTHTIDTPESLKPHTDFGMAVGSMQT